MPKERLNIRRGTHSQSNSKCVDNNSICPDRLDIVAPDFVSSSSMGEGCHTTCATCSTVAKRATTQDHPTVANALNNKVVPLATIAGATICEKDEQEGLDREWM